MRNKIRFLKNVVVLLILIALGTILYKKWTASSNEPELELSESPLQVESIQKIAELATISFKDEVVSDSLERYDSEAEKLAGNFGKTRTWDGLKDVIKGSSVKRRLTLIVKAEAKIGFELTDKNYRVDYNKDTLWFHFPKAKILTINMNPSDTEVFQENGMWDGSGRRYLIEKARRSVEKDVARAQLISKAEDGMENVLRKLLDNDRKILVYFE